MRTTPAWCSLARVAVGVDGRWYVGVRFLENVVSIALTGLSLACSPRVASPAWHFTARCDP